MRQKMIKNLTKKRRKVQNRHYLSIFYKTLHNIEYNSPTQAICVINFISLINTFGNNFIDMATFIHYPFQKQDFYIQ